MTLIYKLDRLEEFSKFIKYKNCTLIGLDIGGRNTGVAFCDTSWDVVSPLSDLLVKEISNLKFIIHDYNPAALIIGWPISLDLQENLPCQRVMTFIEKHILKYNIPIFLEDETRTTKYARDIMSERGFSFKDMNKLDNKIAAKIILEKAIVRFNSYFSQSI